MVLRNLSFRPSKYLFHLQLPLSQLKLYTILSHNRINSHQYGSFNLTNHQLLHLYDPNLKMEKNSINNCTMSDQVTQSAFSKY